MMETVSVGGLMGLVVIFGAVVIGLVISMICLACSYGKKQKDRKITASTFGELYDSRKPKSSNLGKAWEFYASYWVYSYAYIIEQLYPLFNKKIKDGYGTVLLGPLVILWLVLPTIALIVNFIFAVVMFSSWEL
jgi:hypothetical protein